MAPASAVICSSRGSASSWGNRSTLNWPSSSPKPSITARRAPAARSCPSLPKLAVRVPATPSPGTPLRAALPLRLPLRLPSLASCRVPLAPIRSRVGPPLPPLSWSVPLLTARSQRGCPLLRTRVALRLPLIDWPPRLRPLPRVSVRFRLAGARVGALPPPGRVTLSGTALRFGTAAVSQSIANGWPRGVTAVFSSRLAVLPTSSGRPARAPAVLLPCRLSQRRRTPELAAISLLITSTPLSCSSPRSPPAPLPRLSARFWPAITSWSTMVVLALAPSLAGVRLRL